jgi:DNA-binding GntR family transcriptional regulator
LTVSSYTDYKYDKNGNLISEARVQPDPYICWKTEYQYDSNNFKIKTLNFFDNQEPAGYVDHFYLGNLLSNEKFYGGNNNFYCESNYSYDSANNLIEITQTREGETKVLESNRYQNSLIVEKTVYEWEYDAYYGRLNYSFKCIQIYKYE